MNSSGSPIRIDDVRDAISRGEIDLLTCDVFDTLLWRPVAEPHHLFIEVARRMAEAAALPAFVDPVRFMEGRIHAERRARERNRRDRGSTECTLEEIWALMPPRWHERCAGGGTLAEWREQGRDIEITVESSALGVHEPVADLLRCAHDHDVATVLVSDTYFSEAQLRTLLDAAGTPLEVIDRVVVSSERDLAKYAGLLRDVVSEIGATPERTVHLGDNPIADIRAAEELGAIAVASAVDPDELAAPAVLDEIATYSAGRGDDRGVTAGAATLLLDPAVRGMPDAEFGVTVGGPLMYGFTDWASRTAESLEVDAIHCLMREGGFIADLIEIVRPEGPTPRRLHASRWVALRAAVFDGTPDELLRALARNVHFEPAHVVEAFGIDEPLVRRVLGDRPFTDANREIAMERIAGDPELRGAIVASSATLRGRLLRYLDGVLEPTSGRIAICDIGWGGTIQEGLEEILRHEGRLEPDDDLIGLYLSISAAGEHRVSRGARMLAYLPGDALHEREQRALQRTPEIVEQLCTPNVGTMLDVDDDGNPVTAPDDATWTESRGRAQLATREMVARLAGIDRSLHERGWAAAESDAPPVWSDPALRSALLRGLATTLESPTRQLAATLTGWLHDDIAGGRVVPLAQPDQLTFLPFLSAAEIDTVSMKDVFWLAGAAAAANPPLAAQISAASRGVDPEELSPPSEAGTATVAVYEADEQNAVAVDHPVPRIDARGWSLLRLATAAGAVRDIRIDFGDVDHVVELDHLTITFHRGAGDARTTSRWSIDRLDDRRLRWIGAQTLGASRAAVRADGHVIVAVDGRPEADSDYVEIECAFRATALQPDDAAALLPSATRERASHLTHRVRTGLAARARDLRERRAASSERESEAGTTDGASDERPTFSFVLPIYESPLDHLEQQLHAIRSQTYPRWECIVVDDGSTDPAPRQIVERFVGADDRFVLYVRPKNGGIAAATNDALDRAANDWVVFVDHDDLIHADALEVIAGHIVDHPDDEVIYTDEHTVDECGDHIVDYRKPDFSPERLLGHNYFCHIVSMRRSLVERIGRLDRDFEPSADREFNLRAAEAAASVGHVPEILYSWRAIAGSVATSLDQKPEVGRSVIAAAEYFLSRRGDPATVTSAVGDEASIVIRRPTADVAIDHLRIGPATTPNDVDRFLHRSDADVVVLEPIDAISSSPAALDQLISLCARATSPIVGPRIVTDDGRLVSGGRVHHPAFTDVFQGIEADNPGPWGSFVVTREVSSISPVGAVLDRRAVCEVGGFDIASLFADVTQDKDVAGGSGVVGEAATSLDLTMAVLCTVLRESGRPALWSPLMTLVVPSTYILDEAARSALAQRYGRLVRIWPRLADEHYSPMGVHRS
jgi:FMN phosphatase YigB (HAD superfamily)